MTTPAPPPQSGSTAPTTAASVPDLQGLLWKRYVKALEIKRRLHVVHPFVEELTRVTRGKRFRFRNDIVWRAMLDVRDKLVIDLCSLTVEMRHGMKPLDRDAQQEYRGRFKRKRGLFIELRDHHLASLTRTYVPHPDDDEYEIEHHTEGKAEIFARLFPNCTTESPSAADIEDLCERFRLKMVPLKDDRNKNRAHALEDTPEPDKMLWVPDLNALFEYLEDLLEDLSMLSAGPSFGGDNMNRADCTETVVDMVDMILLGSISEVTRLTTTRTRDELYARLHEIDDALQGEREKLHFNDRQFGPPFEEKDDFVPPAVRVRAANPK